MSNTKNLGKCERCNSDILSPMDMKDHRIGEPQKPPRNYRSRQRL